MDENERRPIRLVPPEDFEPIENKALANLKRLWPEVYEDAIVFLGLEKAVQRYEQQSSKGSRGQAS